MASIRLFGGVNVLFRGLNITGTRLYSVFPTSYVSPVYRKEEQQKIMKENDNQLIVNSHVKPAFVGDTCSEFFDETIRKWTNMIMKDGKKALANQIVVDVLTHIKLKQLKKYHNAPEEQKENIELDPKIILLKAIDNCKPVVHTIPIMRGGIQYEVPVPTTDTKARFMAMKWLIESGKQKDRKLRFAEIVAKDIIEASENKGRVVKLKQALHRKCDDNRAYAHYRWIKRRRTQKN